MLGKLKRAIGRKMMESKAMQGMMWKFVTPLLRHILSLAAGWFASKGWITGDQSTEFIDVGLSIVLGGGAYALSVLSKHNDEAKTDKAVEIALQLPTPPAAAVEGKVQEVKAAAAVAVKQDK